MKEYLSRIYQSSQNDYYKLISRKLKKKEKHFIITVNPEILMHSKNDADVKGMLLDKKTSLVPDGIAVVKACNVLKYPVKERITGVEITQYLLEEGNNQNKKIYLFGAKSDVLEDLIKIIKSKYPNLKICGYCDGYVKDKDKIFDEIKILKPDICLVAMGVPIQEKLIYKHINSFEKGIFIGIGGSFDVLSGRKRRAPKLFIKLNLEWLYRIVTEPKRLKRFWNNNLKFLYLINKEKNR